MARISGQPGPTRRVALVTGAARGIGFAIARRLTADGHDVALFDLDERGAVHAAESIPGTLAIAGDVRADKDIHRAIKLVGERFGPINILVNNAGIAGKSAPIEEQSDEDWQRVMDVLLTGTFRWCRAVIPIMKGAGWGRIINIASVAGKEGNPNLIPYSAAKAGVICLTKALAREVVKDGILVNAVAPAVIDTELNRATSPEVLEYMVSRIPMGRLGRPDEVAAAVSFLASDEATFTTGQTLDLSGGRCTY